MGTGFDYRRPLRSFAGAVGGLLFRPARFFAGTGPEGNYLNPLVFVAICGAAKGLVLGAIGLLADLAGLTLYIAGESLAWLSLVLSFSFVLTIFSAAAAAYYPAFPAEAFAITQLVALVDALVLFPFLVLAFSGALHPAAVVAAGRSGDSGFGATFRAVAYSFGLVQLVNWVPIPLTALALAATGEADFAVVPNGPDDLASLAALGTTLGGVALLLFLFARGIRGAHGTGPARAAAVAAWAVVVLVPYALAWLLVMVASLGG